MIYHSTLLSLVLSLSACATAERKPATSNDLEGLKFCRQIETSGGFRQTTGFRTHCLEFKDGLLTDDANTYFGNPPDIAPYTFEPSKDSNPQLLQGEVTVNSQTIYALKGTVLVKDSGAVFHRTDDFPIYRK